jgi:hypothetical protein
MSISKFLPYEEGTWLTMPREYRLACCDCSLVHRFEFRIRDGKIQWRAFRDNRATANRRRAKKRAA